MLTGFSNQADRSGSVARMWTAGSENCSDRYWINWHVPFHIVHFSQKTLTNILKETGFEIQEIRQESPALWLAHSIIVRLFAQFGRPTKQLRNPFLVAALLILIRIFFFPLLWLGNRMGRGDCLVVVARKAPK